MTYLIEVMNQGKPKQLVTIQIEISQFDFKIGIIHYMVPSLRKEGRVFAGGNVVLKERLDAFVSGNEEKITVWGENYFDLADLCLTFEDKVKFQPDSPLLTGIRGVVETQDGLFVAVDAEYVARAVKTKGMKHFKVRDSETVKYGMGDDQRRETVTNVVLLKYVVPSYIKLNANQFNSVNAELLQRNDMILGREMVQDEIVKNGKVIHKAFTMLYPAELVVPLVEKTFDYNRRKYDYDKNMGLYLASPPQNHAEMRMLYVDAFCNRSKLDGNICFGDYFRHVVGVAFGCAAETEKKIGMFKKLNFLKIYPALLSDLVIN